MADRFLPNPNFRRELEAEPAYQRGVAEITGEVAAAIKSAAEPWRNTGYYIRRINAHRNTVRFGDPFWHLSEYGSIHNPPQGNARRGVNALGMRFQDDGPKQAN